LRGYSFDEEGLFRHHAKVYRKWESVEAISIPKKSHRKGNLNFTPSGKTPQARVEAVIEQIVANRVDITQDEPVWFRLACALANSFGEAGRKYFHAVSQFHPEYHPSTTDRKYDHALQAGYQSITLGTFFELAKQ
jgi:hypothetical protein